MNKKKQRLADQMRGKNLITIQQAGQLDFVKKYEITWFRLWWWSRLTVDGKETKNSKQAVLRTINIGAGKKNRWLRTKVQWVKEAFVKKGIVDSTSQLSS